MFAFIVVENINNILGLLIKFTKYERSKNKIRPLGLPKNVSYLKVSQDLLSKIKQMKKL